MQSALLPFDENTVSLDIKTTRATQRKKNHKPFKREPERIRLQKDLHTYSPQLDTVFPQEISPLLEQQSRSFQRWLVLVSIVFSTLTLSYLSRPVTIPTQPAIVAVTAPSKIATPIKKFKRRGKRSSARGLALGR